MTMRTRSNFTLSFGYAAAIAAVASGLLTIAKEKYEPLLAWMKSFTMHHWVTHGLLVLLLFAIVGFALSAREPSGNLESDLNRLSVVLILATVTGAALVGLFYLLHQF